MANLTFLTLDQTGVTGQLRESSNNKRLYEVFANTNAGLDNHIRLNSDVVRQFQQGLSFTCITNNQVSLYRVYNLFNEAELSAINSIFSFDCDFIIISSNITLPNTIISILNSKGSEVLYNSPDTCYIGIYNQRFSILSREMFSSISAYMDFTGFIIEDILTTPSNSYVIPKSEYVTKIIIDSELELDIDYTPRLSNGAYSNTEIVDNKTILIIDSESDITISSVSGNMFNIQVVFLNRDVPSIGIYGFDAALFVETEEDILLRLHDIKEPTGGTWYTKKQDGIWILENDELGNPIKKWFVSNPSDVIREKTLYSKQFKEF